jgi:hemerythrin
MPLVWTPALAVGDSVIDQQHQAIFARASELGDALTRGEGRQRVAEMLRFLGQYTLEHFRDEEQLMSAARYPGLAEHARVHRAFRAETMADRAGLAGTAPSSARVILVYNRVCAWLVDHISTEDRAFGAWSAAAPSRSGASAREG